MLFNFFGFFVLITSMIVWMIYEITTIDRKVKGEDYNKRRKI